MKMNEKTKKLTFIYVCWCIMAAIIIATLFGCNVTEKFASSESIKIAKELIKDIEKEIDDDD